jgi:plasmid stabilization system protein ParE
VTNTVRLGLSAQEDLRQAIQWYEEGRSGLGSEFLAEADHIFDRIKDGPLQFPKIDSGVRRALFRRFPYAVYFIIESDRIEILAVLHLRRDPERWRSR